MNILRINGVISLDLKIMTSTGNEWYSKCIGERFTIHSESKKGGKGKYVVRIPKHLRWLMNGYMYGWVEKGHCILLKSYGKECSQIIIDEFIEENHV